MSRHRSLIPALLLIVAVVPPGHAQTIGAGGVTNASTSDYILNGNVTLSANQTWNAQNGKILEFGTINGNGKALTVTGAYNTTLSGVLSNLTYTNGLTKTGSGTLTLAGNNTFAGTVNVQNGTLLLAHNNALGGSAYGNTVQSGATLALSGGINVTQGSVNLGGAGSGATSGALVNVSGHNTFNSTLNLTADSVFLSQAGTLSLTQAISQGNYDLTLDGPGNFTVSGAISANSGGTLTLGADGTTTISGNVNVSGGVVIDNRGTTNIASSLNLGSGSLTIAGDSTAHLTGSQVNASGGIVISDNANASITNSLNLGGANISLSSSGVIALSGAQINVGNIAVSGTGSSTFSTQINASSFTQTGSGTTTFSGTGNNYFGSVSLQGGTVIANQSGGAAFYTNNLTVDNVELKFESSNQVPTWTSVTLEDNVTLYLNGTTQNFDQLVITGNSIIDFGNGNGSLNVGSLVIDPLAQLTILNWSAENTDVFNAHVDPAASQPNIVFGSGSSGSWDPYSGNITPGSPVPEPAAYGFLLMSASLLGLYTRRPRRG